MDFGWFLPTTIRVAAFLTVSIGQAISGSKAQTQTSESANADVLFFNRGRLGNIGL